MFVILARAAIAAAMLLTIPQAKADESARFPAWYVCGVRSGHSFCTTYVNVAPKKGTIHLFAAPFDCATDTECNRLSEEYGCDSDDDPDIASHDDPGSFPGSWSCDAEQLVIALLRHGA